MSIRIVKEENGQLYVDLPYSQEALEKIRTIEGRRWHHKKKYWSIPNTEEAIRHLSVIFAGEEIVTAASLQIPCHVV